LITIWKSWMNGQRNCWCLLTQIKQKLCYFEIRLFQSFEVYVSDVILDVDLRKWNTAIYFRIGRRFEDWASIRDWTSIWILHIYNICSIKESRWPQLLSLHILFRVVVFHFVSLCFASFRCVRFCFVSHFTGTPTFATPSKQLFKTFGQSLPNFTCPIP
jgi:hypothetical protein